MKKGQIVLGLALALAVSSGAWAFDQAVIDGRLDAYRQQGATEFSVDWARDAWDKDMIADDGEERTCVTCHGADLTRPGKHKKTGKVIDPLSAATNPERFTDPKKIEKWFKRNCEWAWGRECTPQEKGSFLLYLITR